MKNIINGAQNDLKANDGRVRYKPTWDSLETRPIPDWYEDGKIGIFIHWGVFSVPSFVGAGTEGLAEWFWYYWKTRKPEKRYHTKEAIDSVLEYMKNNYPPTFEYTDFAPQFTAEFFDPDHWADIFYNSGAKYVVLTSKHHEGFTLWGSKRSWNWNAVDNGPHRDLVGDLSEAVKKKAGMHFGVYHSLYEWYNPMYLDDRENGYTTNTYITDKLMPELHDVVTKYKPDIVWADGEWEAPCKYWNCTNFIAWLYNDSPVRDTVVTNDRWGKDVNCKHGGYLTCADRFNPGKNGKKQARKWENCMTIDKESWGYRRNAKLPDYFTMEELVEILAQTVSFGGNLLMNIGPTADGRIPPVFEERLRQLGEWLKVNGEAIYGTREWKVNVDPLHKKSVYYTKKDKDIYAITVKWPTEDTISLEAPEPSKTTTVTWLGYNEQISWQQRSEGGIAITLPKISMSKIPCQWGWVFKISDVANIA